GKKRCLASMGIYIFNTDVLIKILYEDAHNLYSTHDFGKDIIPSMIKKYKVWTYNLDSYWRDVGTIDAYYEANMGLLRGEPPFNLYDSSWPINTYLGQLPPANVFSLTLNSLISPGCNIKGQVESSILGPGVFVEEGTRVSDSLLLEGVKIGKYCRIHRAIIDRGVEIENGKKILGYPIFVVSEKEVEKKMPIFIREIRDKKLAKIG
ncbi:MAG TPA: glucose-1-phosphate adenylyltransferase, partial [Candidatus Desulfofervidus auxilii]|nr:glucose-1-phosphate adenylyltransferase [Candidatus Desulfofervidus auxilii]